MASQALYRKWRSQTFDQLIGQQHVTHTLRNALLTDRVGHAYLFSGPRGTGKTSTARLLAKAVNCLDPDLNNRPCNRCKICHAITEGRLLDLIEIDAASNTGVDDIRDLRDKVNFQPSEARKKFYIIDEVHMLSNSAFNALLKTLEEPPGHVIFVLATTEPDRIPDTITSRCQRFDFKRISIHDVADWLAHILQGEGLSADRDALEYIARQGGGSMRDAISLLDQLTAYGETRITLEQVQIVLGTATSQAVVDLVDTLISRNLAQGLDLINETVSQGVDSRQFTREIVEYLRQVMLLKLGGNPASLNLPDQTIAQLQRQAQQADVHLLVQATKTFSAALNDLKSALLAIPQLPLELAYIEAIASQNQPVITQQPQPATTPPPTASMSPPQMSVVPSAVVPVAPPPVAPALPPQPDSSSPQQISPPAPAPPIPTVSTDSPITQQRLQKAFPQIVGLVGQKNTMMGRVLESQSTFQKIDGRDIYFTVPGNFKERFEKPQPRAALNDIFSQVLGTQLQVHFVANDGNAQATQHGPAELAQYAATLAR